MDSRERLSPHKPGAPSPSQAYNRGHMAIGPFQLIRQARPGQRRTLLAAALGWALDAFDAMLYSLVLALLMRGFGMSKTAAGLLGTLTLFASGIGGVGVGCLGGAIGRERGLVWCTFTYWPGCFFAGLFPWCWRLAGGWCLGWFGFRGGGGY